MDAESAEIRDEVPRLTLSEASVAPTIPSESRKPRKATGAVDGRSPGNPASETFEVEPLEVEPIRDEPLADEPLADEPADGRVAPLEPSTGFSDFFTPRIPVSASSATLHPTTRHATGHSIAPVSSPSTAPASLFTPTVSPTEASQTEITPSAASQRSSSPKPKPATPKPKPRPASPAGAPPSASTPAAAPEPTSDGVRIVAPAELRHATEALRGDVARLTLPLDVDGVTEAREELDALLAQLDDYLLPRLRRIDAPVLAVVGGSTGAGKSTLVNSLVRRFVTRPGVLRPTTRSPVLIHHPYDAGAFVTQRILPGLARVTSEAPEPLAPIDVDAPRATALRLVPHEGLAPGLAVVDAPDIDSLVETNRELAVQLLAAADLWIFVTTASRYSDAAPWDMLRTAVDRGVSVAVVLNRVPRPAMNEIRVHLAQLLRDRGLSTAPLFTVPESTRDADGFLPQSAVAPLGKWLERLARDSRARDVVVRRTLVGALDSLHERVSVVATAAQHQADAHGELSASFVAAFSDGARGLATSLGDGSLLRGEILARWQEYAGSGDAFRGLDGTPTRLLDRMSAAVSRERSPAVGPLGDALVTGVQAAITTTLRAAADQVITAWRDRPGGDVVLRHLNDDPRPDTGPLVRRAVADWRATVLDQVHLEALGRWTAPRPAGFGAEGAAVLAQVLVLGSGAPEPPPIVEVAARVLTAVLGKHTDELLRSARADLVERVDQLLAAERRPFAVALGRTAVRDDLAAVLRGHLDTIEGAR
ncbi:MAG: hypothetical protein QG622_2885 [Actinomycetota bacterium]|nr:hypothetical protein [Actinomycetota bacterium]